MEIEDEEAMTDEQTLAGKTAKELWHWLNEPEGRCEFDQHGAEVKQ